VKSFSLKLFAIMFFLVLSFVKIMHRIIYNNKIMHKGIHRKLQYYRKMVLEQ
jgi:hypothetical protein